MEIEYSLDEADLIALAKYQVANSPLVNQRFRVRRFAYLVGFSFMAAGTYLISMPMIIPLTFASMGVLWFILYPLYTKWNAQKNIPRIIHARLRPLFIGDRKLRATPEGLEQASEVGESKVRWSAVDRVIENPAHTFVSIEGDFAIIIARSKIKAGSYEEFVTALRQYQENAKSA